VTKFSREARVGLLFLLIIAIGAYLWFGVLDHRAAEGFFLTAHLKETEGLVPGAKVQLAGIKIGRVKDVRYDPVSNAVVVSMHIRSQYRDSIPDDSQVRLVTKGLLGDKYVMIVPGRLQAAKLKDNEDIKTVFRPTPFDKTIETMSVVGQDLELLGEEARKYKIKEKGPGQMRSMRENAASAFKDLSDIRDNKTKLDTAADDASSAFKTLKQTVSRNRPKMSRLSEDLEKLSQDFDAKTSKTKKAPSELDLLAQDIRAGKGTLGRMAATDELGREARKLKQQAEGLMDSMQKGPGIGARISNDPAFMDDARRMVMNLNKTMEDVSEATPISTLGIIVGQMLR
jgi:phospholipid/cholesterol/gamma-HCH transport system substrate-binding protein